MQDMPQEMQDFLGAAVSGGHEVTTFIREEKNFKAVEEVTDTLTGQKRITKTSGKDVEFHAEADGASSEDLAFPPTVGSGLCDVA